MPKSKLIDTNERGQLLGPRLKLNVVDCGVVFKRNKIT